MTGITRVTAHCPYCLIPKKQYKHANIHNDLIVIFLNAIETLCTKSESSKDPKQPQISSEAASALERFIYKVEESGKRALIVLTCTLSQSTTTEQAAELFNEHAFSKWIRGRIASEEPTDPLFASAEDKNILNKGLSEPADPSLPGIGKQIQHWIRTHQIQDFVIFGKEHLERSPPFKRRAFTLKKNAVLHALLLTQASLAIGIEKYHCKKCTLTTETINKTTNAMMIFIDPTRVFKAKTHQDIFRLTHQDSDFDPMWLQRLTLIFDIFALYKRKVFVVFSSKANPTIPFTETARSFQETFLAPYLTGCTSPLSDQASARQHWLNKHKCHAALNVDKKLIKECVYLIQFLDDSFALTYPNKAFINTEESRHCRFCYLNKIDIKELPCNEDHSHDRKEDIEVTGRIFLNMRLLFLGVEGVLTLDKDQEENSAHCILDDDAVLNLMRLIQKIHEADLMVGIVLTSPLRTKFNSQHIPKYLSKYPFSKYIIGRTVSHCETDPEFIRLKTQKNLIHLKSPIASNTRQMQIYHWQAHHGAFRKPYVTFEASPAEGDSQEVVYTWPLLDTLHIEEALRILKI